RRRRLPVLLPAYRHPFAYPMRSLGSGSESSGIDPPACARRARRRGGRPPSGRRGGLPRATVAARGERSDRVVARAVLHGDPAQFGELVDAGLAAETPVAAGLDAAE